MNTAGRKAKGRSLVLEVKTWLHKVFPNFTDEDVIVPTTSQPGEDLKFSPAFRESFPFSIECKRNEALAHDYDYMEQAKSNAGNYTPIVIMRSNKKPALVQMYLTDFERMIKNDSTTTTNTDTTNPPTA